MNNLLAMTFGFTFSLAVGLAVLGLTVWALVDCIQSKKTQGEKILWVLIIIALNIVGALLYFLLRERKLIINKKRLERSSANRVLAGVCGGIAEYFDIDPTIVRLLFVILTIFSVGTGLLLYIIAAIVMPPDKPAKKGLGLGSIIILSVGAVLILMIIGIFAISIIALSQYERTTVNTQIMDSREVAEMIAKDHIMTGANYQTLSTSGLVCFATEDISRCEATDPYGVVEPECYKVKCRFDSRGETAFVVEAIVSGNRLVNLTYIEVVDDPHLSEEW